MLQGHPFNLTRHPKGQIQTPFGLSTTQYDSIKARSRGSRRTIAFLPKNKAVVINVVVFLHIDILQLCFMQCHSICLSSITLQQTYYEGSQGRCWPIFFINGLHAWLEQTLQTVRTHDNLIFIPFCKIKYLMWCTFMCVRKVIKYFFHYHIIIYNIHL